MTAQFPFPLTTGNDTPPIHTADDLLQGNKLAYIALEDQVYTLRLTRAGKLLLTK